MASIEIGINPGAYNTEDFERSDFNNEYPTRVEVRATATNMGFAPGVVVLKLYNLAQGDPGESSAVASSGWITVPAAIADYEVTDDIEPGVVDSQSNPPLMLTYEIPVPDIVIDFAATVEDDEGNQIEGYTFTVNPYVIPTAPELTAGDIDITVI